MTRYFIEVTYKGTNYRGSQIQENANSIQAEIEKAFKVLHKRGLTLTGSSRTDAGVHALQNFFHFDYEESLNPQLVYKMNALLPQDIAMKSIFQMSPEAHSRFDAVSREYVYHVHRFKDPFLRDSSLYFPYKIDIELMNKASDLLKEETNFFAFSKTNTQAKNFNCMINKSGWVIDGNRLLYNIEANRFLRGMVRSIVATLLRVGRYKLSMEQFKELFNGNKKSGYAVPPYGLFLTRVKYPENYFSLPEQPFTAF